MAKRRTQKREGTRVKLRPADPFELIRWLARSQSDPRKAVAELVQNSLDAGARHVTVERRRQKREVCIIVSDDGEGVLPEMGREAALNYIATHVGHSRKLKLDPAQRAERVVAGKYGVGLLGFWAIGGRLELRSRVAGSELRALQLEEDSPRASIVELPLRTDAAATYTEAAVLGVHKAAMRALGGRRLCDYLAAELRGQLLARDVELVVQDHVARGLAQKRFEVVPRKFLGVRLDLPAEVPVEGHPSIRLDLYLARGSERPQVQVACAGTLVADDIAELGALGLDRAPWVGSDLVGLIDFAGFSVPPGTRRGVAPDAAAEAFVAALEPLAQVIEARLAELEDARREATDRNIVRELRRALRGLRRRLPQYDLPHVEGSGERDGESDPGEPLPATHEPGPPRAQNAELFPPGPLARVRIHPPEIAIAPGAERRIRASAHDADGRAIVDATLQWRIGDGAPALSVDEAGHRPALRARPDAQLGTRGTLIVVAAHQGVSAEASAAVTVAERTDEAALGIPKPRLVSDPTGRWRSRMSGELWEVNDAHEDYLRLGDDPRSRIRYLLALLAKEIVLRTSGRPDAADLLENVVEILAHAEHNLAGS